MNNIKPCLNYKQCGILLPDVIPNIHNDLCIYCTIQTGPHVKLDMVEDCCVCLETKNMIKLKCNHNICYDCWIAITNNKQHQCPICRHVNTW